jgi:hypothetical protein
MFVHDDASPGHRCSPASPDPRLRVHADEQIAMVLERGRARAWSCPHCAVENVGAAHDGGDVVECDYCGRAFGMTG